MENGSKKVGAILKISDLPDSWPTDLHDPQFWEALGRAVATFGHLELVLAQAIFAFSVTKQYPADQIEEEFSKWLPKLQKILAEPLGGLIAEYERVSKPRETETIDELEDFIVMLKEANKVRNAICHGYWQAPDKTGKSKAVFVNKKNQTFDTNVDVAFLKQLQKHTAELATVVISSVTIMGLQFPGSNSPGKKVW